MATIKWRHFEQTFFAAVCLIAASIASLMLLLIVADIFINAIPSLSLYFIFTPESATPKIGQAIGNAIIGTVIISLVATILATPVAVGTAVYLQRYATEGRAVRIFRYFIEVLSGTPSVVLGICGLLILAMYLGPITGGFSLISGSIALAILIIPVIERAAEDAILGTDRLLEEGSYALGATKWETVRLITIPSALSGILTGIILGFGRAAEESAVVILTAGYSQFMPEFGIKHSDKLVGGIKIYPFQDLVGTLPYSVYHAYENSNVIPMSNGFAAAFILICIVLCINLAAKFFVSRMIHSEGRRGGGILPAGIANLWSQKSFKNTEKNQRDVSDKLPQRAMSQMSNRKIIFDPNHLEKPFPGLNVHAESVPFQAEPFEPLFEGEPQPVVPPQKPEPVDPHFGLIDKIIEDLETEIKNNPASAHQPVISPKKPGTTNLTRTDFKANGFPKSNENDEPAVIARSATPPAKSESVKPARSIVKIIVDVETEQKDEPAPSSRPVTPPSKPEALYRRRLSMANVTEHPLPDRNNETPSVSQREIGGMKISGPQPEIDDVKEIVPSSEKNAINALKSRLENADTKESTPPKEYVGDTARLAQINDESKDPDSGQTTPDADELFIQKEIGASNASDAKSRNPDQQVQVPQPKTAEKKTPLHSQIRPFFRTLFPFTIPAAILLLIAIFSNVPPVYHALGPVSQPLAGLFAIGLSILVMVIGIVFALSFAKKSGAFKAPARRTAFRSIAVGLCIVVVAGIICSSAASGIFKTNATPGATTDDRAAKLAAMLAAGDSADNPPAGSADPTQVAITTTPPTSPIPLKDALSLGEIYQYGDSHHHIKVTVYDEKVLPYYFWWWIDYNRFVQSMPAPGNSYVVVFLRVENTGDQSAVIPTADTFTVGYDGNTYTRLPYMNTSVISAFQAQSLRDPVKREQYYQWIREIGESKRDYAYLTGQTYFADSWLDNSTDIQNSTSVNTTYGNSSSGNSTTYSWYYLKPGASQAIDGYLVYEVPDAVAMHLSTTYLNAVFNQISATRWKLG